MLGKQDTHWRKEEENLRRDGPSMANSGPFHPSALIRLQWDHHRWPEHPSDTCWESHSPRWRPPRAV